MKATNKRFSLGWTSGIVLGIASSAVIVFAANVSDDYNYSAGSTISSSDVNTKLNHLKTAINDNNTRITALEGGIGAACTGNNASDEMVRVGSICVDKHPASLWSAPGDGATAVTAIPGTCTIEGTGCADVVAQSRATPGSAVNNTLTYGQAAIACANAGKRLLTAGEWITARATGNLTDITDGHAEWIDNLLSGSIKKKASDNPTDDSRPAAAGYIGQKLATVGTAGVVQLFNDISYNGTGFSWLGFRCAR
ncbi:MAG: hypothetical protein HY308_15380 [Gammaproteobacteria bacterium]|nr:hypothetical protein [Gammaproteobacteria bacterium]